MPEAVEVERLGPPRHRQRGHDGAALGPGEVANSAGFALAALVEQWGGSADRRPVLPDDQDRARALVGEARDADLLLFIGGASATGGVGKVTGAVIGAFVMGVMNNGMSILGIGIDYQQVIKGLVLLAAVSLDVYNRKK